MNNKEELSDNRAASMEKLLQQCIKTGAPIGTIKMSYIEGDFVKLAQITADFNLDPELVKEALPVSEWFKRKTRSLADMREAMAKDESLVKEISSKVSTFKNIYHEYLDDLDSEDKAKSKFFADYGKKVPEAVRKMMLSFNAQNPVASLIIGLAITTVLLNKNSHFMSQYYDDVIALAKSIPGDTSGTINAIIINLFKPIVAVNYDDWSNDSTTGNTTSLATQPKWYVATMDNLDALDKKVTSGAIIKDVFSKLSESIFESAPSAVGFDVEERLASDFVGQETEEALSSFPAGTAQGSAEEYEFIKNVVYKMREVASHLNNNRVPFARQLAAMLMTVLHNRAEGASPDIQKELSELAKKWNRGLAQSLEAAFYSASNKMMTKAQVYYDVGMNPMSECDNLPDMDRKSVRIAKKDIGKGLKKYWKERLNPREKGDFKETLETVKRNVKPTPGKKHSPEGLAAWLEHESTGKWPAEGKKKTKAKPTKKPKKGS